MTAAVPPPGCRWVKQIIQPLDWIIAFLGGVKGDLVRHLTLESYLRRGIPVTITTDASPYGLGGILEIGGEITGWFGDQVSQQDRQVLSLHADPNSKDQQVLEALCMLVALRTWKNYWLGKRVTLSVRTDNIATLTMICKMQPHSAQLGTWVAHQVCSNLAHQWVQPPQGQIGLPWYYCAGSRT